MSINMKAGLLTLIALAATASAQPHHRRHAHHPRDYQDVVTTVVDEQAVAAVNCIVYADSDGNAISTTCHSGSQPTEAPAPDSYSYGAPPSPYGSSEASVSQAAVAPSTTAETAVNTPPAYSSPEAYSPPAYSSPEASPSSSSAEAPAYSSSSSSSSSSAAEAPAYSSSAAAPSSSAGSNSGQYSLGGRGMTWTPYPSKDQDTANSEFSQMSKYSVVRLYGNDMNQTAMVLKAKPSGMKIIAAIDDPINNLETEVARIACDVGNSWSEIHSIIVGNELVGGGASADQVEDAIKSAKEKLEAVGYHGPVTTAETTNNFQANSKLCTNSDYIAANLHPFFGTPTSPGNSASFVSTQIDLVKAACPGKEVINTETGWPWQGCDSSSGQVPSESNQNDAIGSLEGGFSDNIIFMSAFDESWKSGPSYEQYWGIIEHSE